MTARAGRFAALCALASLAGCCKQKLQSVPPQIQLLDGSGATLTGLTFPGTAFGGTASQAFVVKSLSTTPLMVSGLAISGKAAAFYTVAVADGGALPLDLQQDETANVVVTFAPVATPPVPPGLVPEDATVTVTSNDPVNGSIAVPIAGEAAAPAIGVCWLRASGTENTCLDQGPLAVQFGDVPLGKGNSSPPAVISISALSVGPDGGVPLLVTSVAVDAAGTAAGYALVNPIPASPALLDGGALTYYVALFPNALGSASGNLIIESDDPHFPPGSPPQVSLSATVTPRSPPVACEGPVEDAPAAGGTGVTLSADGGGLGPGWMPAPLDTVTLSGLFDAGCSADPVDPQSSLQFAFSFADGGVPAGSLARLQPVVGKPAEAMVQLDLAGSYEVTEVVTDLVNLPSAPASLTFTAQPRDDLAAQLTWSPSASPPGVTVPMQLDLHLTRSQTPGGDPSALLTTDNDCWWDNCLLPLPRLAWGPGPAGFGDPLVGTEFGQPSAPFPQSAEAYTTLSGPQAGTAYDLWVWYFHTESGASAGPCASDASCTEPGYPHCNTLSSAPSCVPSGDARLLVFVGGAEITGGGLTATLGRPCDLWHAGTIAWTSGGAQPGGGALPDVYTFTPDTTVTNEATTGCVP